MNASFSQQATFALGGALSRASVARSLEYPASRPALASAARKAALAALRDGADPDVSAQPWEADRGEEPLRVPALICAYGCGEFELARALLLAGANPNILAQDFDGRPISPFWACARSRLSSTEEIEFLMRSGADALEPASPHVSIAPFKPLGPSPCAVQWLPFMGHGELAPLAVALAGSARAISQLRRYVEDFSSPRWNPYGGFARFDIWACEMLDMMAAHPVLAGRGLNEAATLARAPALESQELLKILTSVEAAELREASFDPLPLPRARACRL